MLTTTEVAKRLGLTVTQKLLDKIGIQPVDRARGGSFYDERDIPKICDALTTHLATVKRESLAKIAADDDEL